MFGFLVVRLVRLFEEIFPKFSGALVTGPVPKVLIAKDIGLGPSALARLASADLYYYGNRESQSRTKSENFS
jgi:hypothetical protein